MRDLRFGYWWLAGGILLLAFVMYKMLAPAGPLPLFVGDKLALTPPMGWNSWYIHYNRVTEQHMREAADVMVSSGYPSVNVAQAMRAALVPIAEQRGTVPVVDDAGRVVGVVTAGDLTRLIERDETGWVDVPVSEVMTRTPVTAGPEERGSAVVHRLEERGVMAAPVVDDTGRLLGVVHLHDLMKAGVV